MRTWPAAPLLIPAYVRLLYWLQKIQTFYDICQHQRCHLFCRLLGWTGYVIQNGISLDDNWPNLDEYWHSKQYLYSYAGQFCIQSMFPCVWLSLAITRPEWIFSPLNFIGRERSITISVYYVKPLSLTAIAQTIAIKSPFKRFAHKSWNICIFQAQFENLNNWNKDVQSSK